MNKNRWGELNWLQTVYQGSHYPSSSLTCWLTPDRYDPGTTEEIERHTVIYLAHNSPADSRAQTHSVVICVGRKSSLVFAGWLIIILLEQSNADKLNVVFPCVHQHILHTRGAMGCFGCHLCINGYYNLLIIMSYLQHSENERFSNINMKKWGLLSSWKLIFKRQDDFYPAATICQCSNYDLAELFNHFNVRKLSCF